MNLTIGKLITALRPYFLSKQADNVVQGDLRSENYSQGYSGWQIESPEGNAEFNDIVARGQFSASTFVMNEYQISGGTQIVARGGRVISEATVSSSFNIDIEDPQTGHAAIASVGEVVRFKSWNGSSSLDVWGTITAVTDMTSYYRYTMTRNSGTLGSTIPSGTIMLVYGSEGSGTIMLTSDQSDSPYLNVVTTPAAPWSSLLEHVRLGKLDGLNLDIINSYKPDLYGVIAGDNLAVNSLTGRYFAATSDGIFLQNIDIKLYSSSLQTVGLTSSGTLKLGTNIASSATTGFFFDASTGDLIVGRKDGSPSEKYVAWNATAGTLTVKGAASLDALSAFSANLGSITAGTITGATIRTAASGARVEMSGTTIFGTNGSVTQWSASGSSLTAGAGAVLLNSDGITITPGTSVYNQITWKNGSTVTSRITALTDLGQQEAHVQAVQNNTGDVVITGLESVKSGGQYIAAVGTLYDGGSHAYLRAYNYETNGLAAFVNVGYSGGVGTIEIDPGVSGVVSFARGLSTSGDILPSGSRDIGASGNPFNNLYVNTIHTTTIAGVLSGAQWQYAGNMTIDAISGSNTVLQITNSGAGTASVTIEGNTVWHAGNMIIGTHVQAFDADLTALGGLAKTDGNFIVGNGSTWVVESGSTARTSLGLAIGTNVQAWDADLDAIAALAKTDGNIIVGNGTTWVAESGNTARTSLSLGTSNSPTFAGLTINGNIAVTGTVDGVDVSDHSARHESGGADEVNHDSLAGFVGNEHIDHTAVTIVAGLGLTGGGDLTANRTIALSTPGSLSATSTNNATGNHTHVIDSSIARSAITISAGNGMSGGGNLTANRTLAVNQDYDFNWTGLHTFNEHTEMESVNVNGALTVTDNLTVFYGGFSPLFVNVDTVNPNNSNVGIMPQNLPGGVPDPQFALDVGGPLRAQYLIGPHAIQLSDAAMIAHFDGPYPFETNFDGSAVGHLGQVATTTGGVIYRPGKFGKAVQLAEATTNLVTNPSFETNTTGWSTTSTNTIARSTAQALYGDYSCEMTIGASRTDSAVLFQSRTLANAAHALTAWVYIPSSSNVTSVQMNLEQYVGATVTNASTSTKGQWVRLTALITPSSTDLSGIIVFRVHGTAGSVAYVDGIQLEQQAYATPYCDGSLGTGHTWTVPASPHASTSSRTTGTLVYNNVYDAAEGTLMLWSDTSGSPNYRASISNNNTGGIWFILDPANNEEVWIGSSLKFNLYVPIPAGWNHWALTWSRSLNQVKLFLNGAQIGTTQTYSTPNLAATFSVVGFQLLDDLVILSRAADAAEIRSIYESNAPVFAESSIEVWRTPTQVPIWVDSEGLWMRSVGGGETLGAYGGAATKSWGGVTLSEGDVLLGRSPDGYVHWDNSEASMAISTAGEVVKIDENGITIEAGEGFFAGIANALIFTGGSTGRTSSGHIEASVNASSDNAYLDIWAGNQWGGFNLSETDFDTAVMTLGTRTKAAINASVSIFSSSDETFDGVAFPAKSNVIRMVSDNVHMYGDIRCISPTIVDFAKSSGNLSSSNGFFTINNGLAGFTLWSYAGLSGTAQTIIPDGTDDVSNGAYFFYWVDPSTGFSGGGYSSVTTGSTNYLWNNGSDQVSISVAANGALTVQRTSGSLTYNVALAILWM